MNIKKKILDINTRFEPLNEENNSKKELKNNSIVNKINIDKINVLNNTITKLNKEYLIQKSEFQNKINIIYERTRKDINNSFKYCLESFIKELLPIIDNLERSFELIKKSENIFEVIGNKFQLVLKNLLELLSNFGVETIDKINVFFDPKIHQAMSLCYSNDIKPNSVVTVLQKGYLLNSRLLRPAMVVVSQRNKS